jgi:hypothetical protein
MDNSTVLLWSLLAEIAEWATRQRLSKTSSAYAEIANDARQHSTPLTNVLAKNLVDALANPNHRGLIDALEDIKNEVRESPPDQATVRAALEDMLSLGDRGGTAYDRACRVVRYYLNRPFN